MALPDAVREWITSLMGDTPADPTETPEPVGQGEDPTTEGAPTPDPSGDPAAVAEADAENPAEESAGDRTAPEPDSNLTDADRDAMGQLAQENEALRQENADLRTRIAELGGDDALGIPEEVIVDLAAEADPEDDYDADADVADQEAELARLRGDTPPEKD